MRATIKRNAWQNVEISQLPQPQNDGPFEVFAKLNGKHLLMANIFKFHEYQTFCLMKMHNMSKIWFVNDKFSLWSLVYDSRAVQNASFNFFLFRFPTLFLVPTIKLYQTISTTTSSNSFAQVTAMIISALSCLDEYLLFAKTLHSAKRCSMVSFILQHTLKHPPWTNPLAAFHDLVFTICSSTVMIEDVFLPCKFWLNQRWHLSSCSCA